MNLNKLDRNQQKQIFFNLVLFILVFFMAIRLPLDTDFWWHIRAGQLTIENGSPVLEDFTSFSVLGDKWINHSWLSQVIYFLINSYFGFLGVMILVAVLATLSMYFVFRRLRSNGAIKAFVLIFCVATTAVVWTSRPQLFSLLLFSILVYLIYKKDMIHSKKWMMSIVIIFLFWGNLHAGFSIGIIFLATFVFGLVLDYYLKNDVDPTRKGKDIFWYFGLLIISSIIVLINPNGFDIWKVQFSTISIPGLQNLIPEWASTNFHDLYQQPFLWLWLMLVFFFMANKKEISFSKIIPFIVLGALGFLSRRNYVYFAIFSIPILSDEITSFWTMIVKPKLKNNPQFFFSNLNKEPKILISKTINSFIIFWLLLFTIGKIVYLGSPIIYQAYLENNYPKHAVDFLDNLQTSDFQCLNSYAWGGYLNWKLPNMKIFIDGRTDLYGELVIQDWLQMIYAEDGWKEKFIQYNINCLILEKDYPIIEELENSSWKNLYTDKNSIIMTKPE